jgi:hypothetical protein
MSYGESVLNYAVDGFTWCPPFHLAGALYGIADKLDKLETYDPVIDKEIQTCLWTIARRIPDGYKLSRKEFIAETEIWRADTEGYERQPTVPLHDILPVAQCILDIHSFFCNGPIRDMGLFAELRRQLFLNQASYHHVSLVDVQRNQCPYVTEVDGEPTVLIDKFLGGTLFRDLFYRQIPFRIPRKTWNSHGIVLAPSGHGKTQLLGSLINGFLNSDDPPGLFVLDPHGDLFNTLRQRVDGGRLVILDPDTAPPPLNFLDFGSSNEAQTLQTFTYLMSSLSGGMSEKGGALVPYLLKLLRKIPGASLETLREVVDEKPKGKEPALVSKFAAAIAALPPIDQGFFHTQWFHSSMEPTKSAIAWRLYAALSSDAFRRMFGAKHNSVNFDRLIAERKVVIVKGGFDALGEEGMRVFLQFLVAQYYAAGMRRLRLPEQERHLNLFICDEASHILTSPIVARLLFDLRKVSCGLLCATQVWEQVSTDVKAAVLGNTAIKTIGPVQFSDASVLSREMYCDPSFIRNMQRDHADPYAPWAMYVNGMTKTAARVTVPFGVLERMPKQRGGHFQEVPPSQPADASTGADQTSEAIPQQPEKAIKPEPSDVELVILSARPIETMLEKHLGATGRGLHEKAQSVKDKLPSYLIRPAFHVAEMRNGVLHEEGFVLRDRAKFIQRAKSVEDYLRQTCEGANKSEPSPEKSTQPAKSGKRRTSRENRKPDNKELPDGQHPKGGATAETVKPGKDWD